MNQEKNRWNNYQKEYKKKKYTQVSIWLDKEMAAKFKKKLQLDGTTASDVIRNAINNYLNGKKD